MVLILCSYWGVMQSIYAKWGAIRHTMTYIPYLVSRHWRLDTTSSQAGLVWHILDNASCLSKSHTLSQSSGCICPWLTISWEVCKTSSHFGQMFALYVGEVVSGYQRTRKKHTHMPLVASWIVWDDDNQILQQRMISILPEHFPLVCRWLGMRGC